MIIKDYENTYTGLKFELWGSESKKQFAVRRLHKEKLPEECHFAMLLGITETYVEEEEVILDDFFEADNLYREWLRIY